MNHCHIRVRCQSHELRKFTVEMRKAIFDQGQGFDMFELRKITLDLSRLIKEVKKSFPQIFLKKEPLLQNNIS